jgi:hypothetical protein
MRGDTKQMRGMLQDILKRQEKTATKEQVQDLENTLLDLENNIGLLVEIEARAKTRRKFADDFS